jgi:hypothetical protein
VNIEEDSVMPLIKDAVVPATKAQRRVQAAAWVLIYGGLLTLLTGFTQQRSYPGQGWQTGETLMLVGSLATAVGAVLIYIRSLMKNTPSNSQDTPP